MSFLGLYNSRLFNLDPNPLLGWVHKNLLVAKVNVFQFVSDAIFKKVRLFPSVGVVSNLTSRFGPVACAVDDLEFSLSGSGEQIDIFNNFMNFEFVLASDSAPVQSANNFDMMYSPELFQFSSLVSTDMDPPPFEFEKPTPKYSAPLHLPSQSQPTHTVVPSHFTLNMIGLNAPTYFNDFKHPQDNQSIASLIPSSESFVSPLDEDFVKQMQANSAYAVPAPRKRKLSPANSPVDRVKQEHDFVPDLAYEPKRAPVLRAQSIPTPHLHHHHDELGRLASLTHKKVKLEESPDSVRYECPHCQARFKVKSYLTRHLKKHNLWKAFVCPFYQDPVCDGLGNSVNPGTKCHPTGGFSRRDTFKTHLKALHFIYPPGTKSSERNSISGRCAGCFQFFENNLKWLEDHIEPGNCSGTVSQPN